MFYGSLLLLKGKTYVIMPFAMSHMCNNCTTFHGIQSLSSSLTFIQTCPRVKNLMTTIKIHIVYGRSSQNVFIGKILSQNSNKQTSIDQTKNVIYQCTQHKQKMNFASKSWDFVEWVWIYLNTVYSRIFVRLKGKGIVNRKYYVCSYFDIKYSISLILSLFMRVS